MQPFTYVRPDTLEEALHEAARPGTSVLAGGTTMVDLMRGDLAAPHRVVDIGHLSGLSEIDATGGLVETEPRRPLPRPASSRKNCLTPASSRATAPLISPTTAADVAMISAATAFVR